MRVLVTGASGFSGPAVMRALGRAGHEPIAGVRRRLEGSPCRVLPDFSLPFDAEAVVSGFEAVVHLAGIAHASVQIPKALYDAVNAEAVGRLAAASARCGVKRFILVSSVRAQAGPCAPGVLTEAEAPVPSDDYGRSKLKGESAAREAFRDSAADLVVLRPVLMHGAGAKGNMGALMHLARSPFPLPVGGFTARRSLLGVENFGEAVVHALAMPAAAVGTFLVADDDALSIGEICTALRQGLGRPPRIVSIPLFGADAILRSLGRAETAARLFGDLVVSTHALRDTGWRPVLSARQGLARAMVAGR